MHLASQEHVEDAVEDVDDNGDPDAATGDAVQLPTGPNPMPSPPIEHATEAPNEVPSEVSTEAPIEDGIGQPTIAHTDQPIDDYTENVAADEQPAPPAVAVDEQPAPPAAPAAGLSTPASTSPSPPPPLTACTLIQMRPLLNRAPRPQMRCRICTPTPLICT